MTDQPQFDPAQYKKATTQQWDAAAKAWDDWGPTLHDWLGPVTELMFDLAGLRPGSQVLDVAAGAGEQTVQAAGRVGPTGRVLATDISPRILERAAANARRAGLSNVECKVLDGENLDVASGAFDAVISRVGLVYFPDQQKALAGMKRALRPGGRIAAIVYSTPDRNQFFSGPVSIIRRRANLPPPLPGQPGPFSLGGPGILEEAFREAGLQGGAESDRGGAAEDEVGQGLPSLREGVVRGAASDAERARPRGQGRGMGGDRRDAAHVRNSRGIQ